MPGPEIGTGHSQGTKHSLQFHGAHLPQPSWAVNTGQAGEEDTQGPEWWGAPGLSQWSRRQIEFGWAEESGRQHQIPLEGFIKGEMRNMSAADGKLKFPMVSLMLT